MSAETMLHFLTIAHRKKKFGFRVVTQCAPVLKGVKISNLNHHETGRMAQDSGVFKEEQNYLHSALCRCRKGSIIPLPLRAAGAAFENREVREFLRGCGYESFEVASVLVRLRRRYRLYAGISKEFPHELGVLLGYPVGDVQGFIDNRGENSLNFPLLESITRIPKKQKKSLIFMTG